jgi:hypothetical protein
VAATCAVLAAFSDAPPASAHADGSNTVRLTVDGDAPTSARVNRKLVGVNWAGELPRTIRPLGVDLARLDASVERLFPKGPDLDRAALARLNASLDRIFRAGGRPLVILAYMPTWLADARPGDPRDRTKLPPRDRALWGRLVREVVTGLTAGRLSRGKRPVQWFEVWNEPDWPIFYQDRQDRFLSDILAPSARAVAAVERERGLDLLFGGCACVAPDPAWIEPMVAYARDRDLPLDFVSWHWYANHPFLGPDGQEPLGTPESQEVIKVILPLWARRNPVASPVSYGEQIGQVRSWVEAGLAGSGRRMPELVIDEWNMSAGGFDRRMDTHEGAAFAAGVLTEMQQAELDRGAVFRAVDPSYFADPQINPSGEELHGGWGLVTLKGTRKPAWWTFRLWRRLSPAVLQSTLDSGRTDGVWAIASRARVPRRSGRRARRRAARRRKVTVLAASFLAEEAHDHALSLEVSGLTRGRWRIGVRRIDAGHPVAREVSRRRTRVRRGGSLSLSLELPSQSVVFVELRRR